jgi:hypothetical protein
MESKSSLSEKVLNWIKSQGYPLEMEVASKFRVNGFEVKLSESYIDYETKERREIDVTASKNSRIGPPAAIQICSRIECKSTKDKPWINFIENESPLYSFESNTFASGGARLFLVDLVKNKEIEKRLDDLLLFGSKRIGYGIVQAFKPAQDIAYHAINSCVKASIDRMLAYERIEILRASQKGLKICCVLIPAIIVDAEIFECNIDEHGEPVINSVTATNVIWRGSRPQYGPTVVRLVQKNYLEEYVKYLQIVADTLFELAASNIKLLESSIDEANESAIRGIG